VAAIPHGARRVAGSPPWRPMIKGPAWEKWISAAFKFHLTVEPPELNDTVSEDFFMFSNGNSDTAVSLFTTAQGLALARGSEEVQSVDYKRAKKHLYMMDPELKRGRMATSKKYAGVRHNHDSSVPIEDPVANLEKVEEEPVPLR